MEEIHEEIKEAVRQLETYKNRYKTMNTQDVIDMLKRLNENVKLTIPVVVDSKRVLKAWDNGYSQGYDDGNVGRPKHKDLNVY